MKQKLFIVDVEAPFGCKSPATGNMTEFGAVHLETKSTFHGLGYDANVMKLFADWVLVKSPNGAIFVSDNPAYDWQWINFYFDKYRIDNPFGFSARRIGDFYAGLRRDFWKANNWKGFRKTVHDHHPVNDAMGNAEALEEIVRRNGAKL